MREKREGKREKERESEREKLVVFLYRRWSGMECFLIL